MRRASIRMLALGAALLGAPAAAQGGGDPVAAQQEPGAGQAQGAAAWQFLRDNRAELGITDEQQGRLSDIAARLEETNRPFRMQLREQRARLLADRRAELMRMTPQERRAELDRLRREGGGPVPESMRPLLEQIRANQRDAMRQAQGVLTPQQKQRARAMFQEWRRQRRMGQPGRMRGGGMLRRGGGMRPGGGRRGGRGLP